MGRGSRRVQSMGAFHIPECSSWIRSTLKRCMYAENVSLCFIYELFFCFQKSKT